LLKARRFAFALALGLLVRVAVLRLPGHEDVVTWRIWSYAAAQDVTAMYGVGGTPPERGIVRWGERWTTVDYPPLFLYECALVGRAYRFLFPSFPDSDALLIAVKLPVLLANIGLTALIFCAVGRVASVEAARWAALAYWLNPATLFGGELLGYVDALFMLPAVAGLMLAHRGRPSWAGLLTGVAVATKPQGVLIGPAFALALWQAGGWGAVASAATTFGAAIVAAAAPFYLRGAMANMWLAFGAFGARRDTLSAYATNLGWIVNWWLRGRLGLPEFGFPRAFMQVVPRPLAVSRFRELGYPDPSTPGRAVVVAAAAWAIWKAREARDLAMVAAAGAFTVHAFYIFSVGLHENHQLLEIPLLALAAATRPRLRPLLAVVSAVVALNMNAMYGFGLNVGWAVPRTITGVDLTVVLAVINAAALIWFAAALHAEAQGSPGRPFQYQKIRSVGGGSPPSSRRRTAFWPR
jgi:hypothetical protein